MTEALAERSWNVALRAQGEDALEIAVYDVIGKDFWTGEGVTSKDVLDQLRAQPKAKKIELRVNSIGGLVDEAKAMGNLLAERAANGVAVTGWVDGIAASSASYLLTFAQRVVMPSNTFQMLHGVRGCVRGTAEDMARGAQLMRRMNQLLADAYAAASARRGKNKTAAEFLREFASGDTYLDADEAIAWGLADEKIEATKVAACLADLGGFEAPRLERAPEAVRSAPYVLLAQTDPNPQPPAPAPAPTPSAAPPAPAPTPPAPVARNNNPEPTGKEKPMAETENKTNYGSIIAALGLLAGATETDILNRVGRLREVESQAMALTGVTDSAQLLGGLRGMKERADAADKATAELGQVKAERDKQRFEGLVARGQAERKLTPAEAKHYQERFTAAVSSGRSAECLAELEGYLAVAPRKFAEPHAQPAPARGTTSPGSASLTWNGKTYGELAPIEKHRLQTEDPELFAQLRAEHRQSA